MHFAWFPSLYIMPKCEHFLSHIYKDVVKEILSSAQILLYKTKLCCFIYFQHAHFNYTVLKLNFGQTNWGLETLRCSSLAFFFFFLSSLGMAEALGQACRNLQCEEWQLH